MPRFNIGDDVTVSAHGKKIPHELKGHQGRITTVGRIVPGTRRGQRNNAQTYLVVIGDDKRTWLVREAWLEQPEVT